jgi:hypothetical protein
MNRYEIMADELLFLEAERVVDDGDLVFYSGEDVVGHWKDGEWKYWLLSGKDKK